LKQGYNKILAVDSLEQNIWITALIDCARHTVKLSNTECFACHRIKNFYIRKRCIAIQKTLQYFNVDVIMHKFYGIARQLSTGMTQIG